MSSKHSQPGDLWISIQGKVYDVSDWMKTQPGGDLPLLNLAGQDVTDAYIALHPPTAWQHLDKFFNRSWCFDLHVLHCNVVYCVFMVFCVPKEFVGQLNLVKSFIVDKDVN
ncbi:hypothetical protein L1987_74619 [Smallanthus sonchifolius]|uniref:Uncharacterized protein n=1 Tax=Smallanthus sonchifolius TaxID=185202 RepID=A0ACB9A478_9ASTR|nr:hypothetical protein L1987_74619 [Smallanthus sonchifolius]